MVIYHVKFSKEMLIWIYIHTHRNTHSLQISHTLLFLSPFPPFKKQSRSHTAFFSPSSSLTRVNILALKKSRLEREQESGVNGVSLKKLFHRSPLHSAGFPPAEY